MNLSDLSCHAVRSAVDQCAFVAEHCQDEHIGRIDYLALFYCTSSQFTAFLVLVAFIVWLVVLFMSLGIAASDFLCPNVSTIAKSLKLSDSLVGVTFLSLANGAPDIFSTYAAMKSGSGAMALGELVGAASFITSVVLGAMALVSPFRVTKGPFLRDIIFFTLAILTSLYVLSDGVLSSWECILMLTFYVCYVVVVIAWHWYTSDSWFKEQGIIDVEPNESPDQRDLEESAGLTLSSSENEEPNLLSVNSSRTRQSSISSAASHNSHNSHNSLHSNSSDNQEAYNEVQRLFRLNRGHSNSSVRLSSAAPHEAPRTPMTPIRPSLFSAIEFQSILSTLEEEAHSSQTLGLPLRRSPVPHEHQTAHHQNHRQHRSPSPVSGANEESSTFNRLERPSLQVSIPPQGYPVPSLKITDLSANIGGPIEESDNSTDNEEEIGQQEPLYNNPDTPTTLRSFPESRNLLLNTLHKHLATIDSSPEQLTSILFPTLSRWKSKSILSKVVSLLMVVPVLLLTVIIPIKDISGEEAVDDDMRNAFLPLPGEDDEPIPGGDLILLEIQAVCSPFLLSFVLVPEANIFLRLFVSATVSLILLAFLSVNAKRVHKSKAALAFVGFLASFVLIGDIATEVVAMVKALGVIFNISDAVLGLTVFAVGNSLADLVSNVALARMGLPMMAIAACFGGPMLNILVGISVSGLILLPSGKSLGIDISLTLIVSTVTLLCTVLFIGVSVSLNNWRMTRTIGTITITFWVIMTVVLLVINLTM